MAINDVAGATVYHL